MNVVKNKRIINHLRLTEHDLRQISHEYLGSLPQEKLIKVAENLLDNLKDARDSLNQNPQNSSRPPSSQDPWLRAKLEEEPESNEKETEAGEFEAQSDLADEPSENNPPDEEQASEKSVRKKSERKAGKQKGAVGVGRTQKLLITAEDIHYAAVCVVCNAPLKKEEFVAVTGHYVIDIEIEEQQKQGIHLTNIKHIYGDTRCDCGHITRTQPNACPDEKGWTVEMSEWHLVGTTLMSFIICLALRMRLSRKRIQEFLNDWLHLQLSIGTINQCIHEGGRAVEPVEEQMIEEVVNSKLLHVDETSWKESGQPLWMWVFVTATITLYMIGNRTSAIIDSLLGDKFFGWLMSDGYRVYRVYQNRLRCWAHLIRKAKGLKESVNNEASLFGSKVVAVLDILMNAVYQARDNPDMDIAKKHDDLLQEFRALCERYQKGAHEKTRLLAGEFLNDWGAIFRVLQYPHLPLTNNEAERALRHWVIARKLSYGTRTTQGSRSFALLASVIETCRKRKVSPWNYLADVIAIRRKGGTVPAIPCMA